MISSMYLQHKIGERVFVRNQYGTLRYIGILHFEKGIWCGIELDMPNGNSTGVIDGIKYFHCKANHAIFVRPSELRELDEGSQSNQNITNKTDDFKIQKNVFGMNKHFQVLYEEVTNEKNKLSIITEEFSGEMSDILDKTKDMVLDNIKSISFSAEDIDKVGNIPEDNLQKNYAADSNESLGILPPDILDDLSLDSELQNCDLPMNYADVQQNIVLSDDQNTESLTEIGNLIKFSSTPKEDSKSNKLSNLTFQMSPNISFSKSHLKEKKLEGIKTENIVKDENSGEILLESLNINISYTCENNSKKMNNFLNVTMTYPTDNNEDTGEMTFSHTKESEIIQNTMEEEEAEIPGSVMEEVLKKGDRSSKNITNKAVKVSEPSNYIINESDKIVSSLMKTQCLNQGQMKREVKNLGSVASTTTNIKDKIRINAGKVIRNSPSDSIDISPKSESLETKVAKPHRLSRVGTKLEDTFVMETDSKRNKVVKSQSEELHIASKLPSKLGGRSSQYFGAKTAIKAETSCTRNEMNRKLSLPEKDKSTARTSFGYLEAKNIPRERKKNNTTDRTPKKAVKKFQENVRRSSAFFKKTQSPDPDAVGEDDKYIDLNKTFHIAESFPTKGAVKKLPELKRRPTFSRKSHLIIPDDQGKDDEKDDLNKTFTLPEMSANQIGEDIPSSKPGTVSESRIPFAETNQPKKIDAKVESTKRRNSGDISSSKPGTVSESRIPFSETNQPKKIDAKVESTKRRNSGVLSHSSAAPITVSRIPLFKSKTSESQIPKIQKNTRKK